MAIPYAKQHTVSRIADLPTERAYMIATEESVYVPGDERSRTHPGHGHPGYTMTHLLLHAYQDETEWKAEIEKLASAPYPRPFRAFIFDPAAVSTVVHVSLPLDGSRP